PPAPYARLASAVASRAYTAECRLPRRALVQLPWEFRHSARSGFEIRADPSRGDRRVRRRVAPERQPPAERRNREKPRRALGSYAPRESTPGNWEHSTALKRAPEPAQRRSVPRKRSEERRVGKECRSRWAPCH